MERANAIAQHLVNTGVDKSLVYSLALSYILLKEAEFHCFIKQYDVAIQECQKSSELRATDSVKLTEAFYCNANCCMLKDGNNKDATEYLHYACKILEGKLLTVQGMPFVLKPEVDYRMAEMHPSDTDEVIQIKCALIKVHERMKMIAFNLIENV